MRDTNFQFQRYNIVTVRDEEQTKPHKIKNKEITEMTINYEKKAIELTTAEMKEAKKFGSDMYKMVREARRDFAGFEVKEVKAMLS